MRSVALGIWVDVGSRDERPALSGASHFLEHLLFKGTKGRSARRIAEAFDHRIAFGLFDTGHFGPGGFVRAHGLGRLIQLVQKVGIERNRAGRQGGGRPAA